jgi:hypothetical protein
VTNRRSNDLSDASHFSHAIVLPWAAEGDLIRILTNLSRELLDGGIGVLLCSGSDPSPDGSVDRVAGEPAIGVSCEAREVRYRRGRRR